ncbi:MAG: DUF3306 domain-containing protein [Chromatiaceae bacterium]
MRHDDDPRAESEPSGPLKRWSRRKQAARRAPQQAPVLHAPAEPYIETGDRAVALPRPCKTDADMPLLDLLTADSDLSDFFSPDVSEDLRREALRRVFALPRYNLTDGLDDYAEDYTAYRPLGELVTAGLRRHRDRLAAHTGARTRAEPTSTDASTPTGESQQEGQPTEADPGRSA